MNEKSEYPAALPHFSGIAKSFILKVSKLIRVKMLMRNASWLPYCNISELVLEKFEMLATSINERIKNLFQKWINYVGENPQERLKCFLMKRKNEERRGKLECNMDPLILDLCHEAHHWLDAGFSFPINIQLVHEKWDSLCFVYESVLSVTLAYNKILDGNLRAVNTYHMSKSISPWCCQQ